jgi:hypothetical protein
MVAAGRAAPMVGVRDAIARPWAWRSLTLLTPGPATFPEGATRLLYTMGTPL